MPIRFSQCEPMRDSRLPSEASATDDSRSGGMSGPWVDRVGGAGIGGAKDDGRASGWIMTAADSIPAARSRRYTRVVSSRMSCCSLWSSLLSLFNVTPRARAHHLGDPAISHSNFRWVTHEVSLRVPDFRVRRASFVGFAAGGFVSRRWLAELPMSPGTLSTCHPIRCSASPERAAGTKGTSARSYLPTGLTTHNTEHRCVA